MRKGYGSRKDPRKVKRKVNIFSICFILFSIYFVYTIFFQQMQIDKYNSQISMYEADIESKNELIKYYGKQKSSVTTDEYIEKVARETLGYVKPYEKIFVDANK